MRFCRDITTLTAHWKSSQLNWGRFSWGCFLWGGVEVAGLRAWVAEETAQICRLKQEWVF